MLRFMLIDNDCFLFFIMSTQYQIFKWKWSLMISLQLPFKIPLFFRHAKSPGNFIEKNTIIDWSQKISLYALWNILSIKMALNDYWKVFSSLVRYFSLFKIFSQGLNFVNFESIHLAHFRWAYILCNFVIIFVYFSILEKLLLFSLKISWAFKFCIFFNRSSLKLCFFAIVLEDNYRFVRWNAYCIIILIN